MISKTCLTNPLRRQMRSAPPLSRNALPIAMKLRSPMLLTYTNSPKSTTRPVVPSAMQALHCCSNRGALSASMRPETRNTTWSDTCFRSIVTIVDYRTEPLQFDDDEAAVGV